MRVSAEVVVERPLEVVERSPPRRQVVRSIAGPDSAFTRHPVRGRTALLRRSMSGRIAVQLERLKAAIELTGAN